MATKSFKVIFNDETRRFKLTDVDFDTFKAKVGDVLRLTSNEPTLKWKDSDGDYISINSQEEFEEAVQEQTDSSSASSVVKIYVSQPAPSSFSTSSVSPPTHAEPRPSSSDSNQNVDIEQQQRQHENQNTEVKQSQNDVSSSLSPSPSTTPPPPPAEPVTHPYVECDGSGQTPLRGIRFHKIGENYDLNEAEFAKLDDGQKTQFEMILHPGAQPIRWEPVVHYDVVCDASNVTPIFGTRFHKINENYDLAFDEFIKLSEEEKRKYQLLNHPRGKPVPYYTPQDSETEAAARDEEEAVRRIVAAVVGGLFNMDPEKVVLQKRNRCPARCRSKHCKNQQNTKKAADSKSAGQRTNTDRLTHSLPNTPAAIGSYGPGIVRLQKFLIEHGLMDASAIRWRAGVFGPRTQQAIYQFQLANTVDTQQFGVYDEPTAAALKALAAKTTDMSTEGSLDNSVTSESNSRAPTADCNTTNPTDLIDHQSHEDQENSDEQHPDVKDPAIDSNTEEILGDDLTPANEVNVAHVSDNQEQVNADNREEEDVEDEKKEDKAAATKNLSHTGQDNNESEHNQDEDDDIVVVEPEEVAVESSKPESEQSSPSDWQEELKILKSMGFVNEKALIHLLNHNKDVDPARPLEATIAALLR